MGFPTFEAFFRHCTGFAPYRWQQQLADRACRGDWPDRIEVPTGLGKTSAILIALYAAAFQGGGAAGDGPRTTPQRIVHVVNRRTVVDQTHGAVSAQVQRAAARPDDRTFGEQVSLALDIEEVRAALSKLAGPWDRDLVPVRAIHGESADTWDWLRPTGVTILTMTPHQLVSRLLMRGYGVSSRTRSLHAGLLGVDTLVLFDEPHLAPQAVSTVERVLDLQSGIAEPTATLGVPPSRLVLLGATMRESAAEDSLPSGDRRITITPGDVRDAAADQLLQADKSVQLVEAPHSDAAVRRALVAAYQEQRRRLGPQEPIAVLTNTVAMAQDVHRDLTEAGEVDAEREGAGSPKPVLITSRMRPVDRPSLNQAAPEAAQRLRAVVATQCLEVGVDLSFTALITELAPYPVMQQRLGRLNRHSRKVPANAEPPLAVVILPKDVTKARKGAEVIYGLEPLLRTAELLREEADADGRLNLSVSRQIKLATDSERREALASCWPEEPRTATFHEGYLEVMAHTAPTPWSDLPLGAFIAGPDARDLDVLVAWRRDPRLLDRCDVLPGEQVSVPLPTLRSMLGKKHEGELADLEVWPGAPEPAVAASQMRVRVRRERGWEATTLDQVGPGDEVVLDSGAGGYSPDLGVRPGRISPVPECSIAAALAAQASRGRPRHVLVALTPATLEDWWAGSVEEAVVDAGADSSAAGPSIVDVDDVVARRARFVAFIASLAASPDALDLPETMEEAAEWLEEFGLTGASIVEATSAGLLVEIALGRSAADRGGVDSGSIPSSVARRPQLLGHHAEQVRRVAEAAAQAAGLLPGLVEQVALAGLWHDVGKSDPRFQAYLHGTTYLPGAIERPERTVLEPWAKSRRGMRSRMVERRYLERAGLPASWRHEAESARMCSERGLSPLVTHLVASSHGRARPLIQWSTERSTPPEWVMNFRQLNQEFGPWGLAYLEATVRLSDWFASSVTPETYERVAADWPLSPVSKDGVPSGAPASEIPTHRVGTSVANLPGPVAGEVTEVSLRGLEVTPLTGWFAVAGLLRTAYDAGDRNATICWEHPAGLPPRMPTWRSTLPLEEVCERLLGSEQWGPVVKFRLWADYQTPTIESVSSLLRTPTLPGAARPWLAEGLAQDAQGVNNKMKVLLTVPARANNSSFVGVARKAQREMSPRDLVESLLDGSLGWRAGKCDGGMDRAAFDGGVTGREVKGSRLTRTFLAPAAVMGMASMGAVGLSGLGVNRRRLHLPLPSVPSTWNELVAYTHGVQDFPGWRLDYRTVNVGYELLWSGGVARTPGLGGVDLTAR